MSRTSTEERGPSSSVGTKASTTNRPPGARTRATSARQARWAAAVVRLKNVLRATSTTSKGPSGRGPAMSPATRVTRSAPGLAASRSSMAAEASRPVTARPSAARGRASRPVPTPSSRRRAAGPATSAASATNAVTQAAVASSSAYQSS